MWIMYQCPGMVEDCLQYVKGTIYDDIRPLATLDLKDTNQDVDHDKMTSVIRYKTPYTVQDRGPFLISFTLEHDVTLHCVL